MAHKMYIHTYVGSRYTHIYVHICMYVNHNEYAVYMHVPFSTAFNIYVASHTYVGL